MSDNKKNTAFTDTGGVYLDTGPGVAIERVNINGQNKFKIRPMGPSPGMVYIPGKPESADLRPRRQRYPHDAVVKHIKKLVADWKADKGPKYSFEQMVNGFGEVSGAFPGISTYQVRLARKDSDLPEEWITPGRDRK
jgi:hypothetical protein